MRPFRSERRFRGFRLIWLAAALAGMAAPVLTGAQPTAGAESGASAGALAHQAEPLPGMRFSSTIANSVLYDALRSTPKFARLDNELHGSPLSVSVTHVAETSSASKAGSLTSALFAGVTLGLLPVVTNRDFTVKYEIYVNGNLVTSRSYARHISRVFNLHSKDTTYGLGEDGLAWLKGTATQFATDATSDPKVDALIEEYHVYFDPQATATR
jgi:hypothetical protein